MVRVDSIDFGQRFADSVPLSIRPLKGHSPALRPREVLDTERWKERACVGYYRSLFVFSGGKKRLNRERCKCSHGVKEAFLGSTRETMD